MGIKRFLTGSGIAAVLFAFILALVIVDMGVGIFVVPKMVDSWKAQGLKEAPVMWQFVIDSADFCNHFWFILLPLFFFGSIFLAFRAVRGQPKEA